MKLVKQTPKQSLSKILLKQRPFRKDIERFKANLLLLLSKIDEIEREENQKNHIRDFLRETFYKETNEVNTKDSKDLVIHLGKSNRDNVGVIFEAKRPSNKNEMITLNKPNCKAFQELVLYYLRERIEEHNSDIKYCIATNVYEWYIFDASYFEKFFYRNKILVTQYEDWRDKKKVLSDTFLFYNDIAKPFLDSIDDEIPCTYFDIRDYEKSLKISNEGENKQLIALYKIFSPQHLLKQKFIDDSNKLDEKFYKELLHIIGLEEEKDGSKVIIRRKSVNPDEGSLIENTINIIQTENLNKVSNLGIYGDNKEDRIYNIALELCITWINRILFLKLLEAQLKVYHGGDKEFSFLNILKIPDFDELYKLFHQVLAKDIPQRTPALKVKFNNVPYLNSSLFEISELEDQTIKINSLDNSLKIRIHPSTVLKELKQKKESLTLIEYLFGFLNYYDFASEGDEDIQEDQSKSLINASVLGKVFEKINGYKDGSIFTPGFITMYMSSETVRQAVMNRFKEVYGWKIDVFDDIKNNIADFRTSTDILRFNRVIDSIRICDPAVGSGHFLVSVLNEIIAIKYELGLFADEAGVRLSDYDISVVNDELYITDMHNDFFKYQIVKGKPKAESQRLQKTLFNQKRTIIENCLFGVDINPNSVKICRLRLWIELLKNSFYKEKDYTELETLPNIDINIKCGNSLVSRYEVKSDIKDIFEDKMLLDQYKISVAAYKNCTDRQAKDNLLNLIKDFRSKVINNFYHNLPANKRLNKLKGQLNLVENKALVGNLFEKLKEKDIETDVKKLKQKIKKAEDEIQAIKVSKIYQNAFEWRFEFPEVLDEDGNFLGFDVVIGNPPYIKEYDNRSAFDGVRNKIGYQGKMDIWYLFGHLGIELLKKGSYLCFIATNNWVTNYGASKFRNFIVKNTKLLSLIDFGSYMIFENASIQTMIMLLKNDGNIDNYRFDYRKLVGESIGLIDVNKLLQKEETNTTFYLEPTINKNNYTDTQLVFNTTINDALLEKIKSKQNFHLIEKADKKFKIKSELANGIHTHHDNVNKDRLAILGDGYKLGEGIFVLTQEELESLKLTKKESELIKPLYTTKELHKYYADSKNKLWIIYTRSDIGKPDKKTKKIPIDEYPLIKNHLLKYQTVITSDNRPFGLHRAREQYFFEGEKIIATRKCPKEPIFTYSNFPCFATATFYLIQSERINLKYLTGLLNSKLVAFWLRKKGKMQGNNYQIDKEPLLDIPIYKPKEFEMNRIAEIVDNIILLKSEDKETISEENKIDTLVYELYGLTEEEIKIVEEV